MIFDSKKPSNIFCQLLLLKKVYQIKLNHCALAMSEDAAFMMLESGDLYS
jgi:hypothetical protein